MTAQRGADNRVGRLVNLRLAFMAIAGVAVVLGYVGFRTYVAGRPEFGHSPADLLYYSCQLFVLDAEPLDRGGPLPLSLDLARYLAPLATVYALAETVRLLGAGELRRLRMARLRDHRVVCGAGPAAQMLAARLHEAGRAVVVVSDVTGEDDGIRRVTGDPRNPEALRTAGVARAHAVYACGDDSGDNVLIAAAVRELARDSRRPLSVYAAIDDQDLCNALQARHLMGTSQGRTRLDFFNVDVLAARRLAETEHIEATVAAEPPHCLVVGVSPFARAFLVELARRWRLREGSSERLPVTWAGAGATAALERLSARYEFLPEALRIVARDIPETGPAVDSLLGTGGPDALSSRPDRVYICGRTDETSLSVALTALNTWKVPPGCLTVQLRERGPFGMSLGNSDTAMLDDLDGRLVTFGVLDAACRPELLGDDLLERLARAFHDEYVLARKRDGETSSTNPSMVPWEQLSARKQDSNREAVSHIGVKLRTIGCAIAPRGETPQPFALTDDEIKQLAVLEHRRWVEAQRAAGITHGSVRDEVAGTHPVLVEWHLLSEERREIDRDTVRALPSILAAAGFQIVRLNPTAGP
jgi:hypothetical protein